MPALAAALFFPAAAAAVPWSEIHEGVQRWNQDPSQPDLERLSALIARDLEGKSVVEQKDQQELLRREFSLKFTTFAARFHDESWNKKLQAWRAILLNESKTHPPFMQELALFEVGEFILSLGPEPPPEGEKTPGGTKAGAISGRLPASALIFDRSNGDESEVLIDANDFYRARDSALKMISQAIEDFLARGQVAERERSRLKERGLNLLAMAGARPAYLARRHLVKLPPLEEMADLLVLPPLAGHREVRAGLEGLAPAERPRGLAESVSKAYEHCQTLAPLPLDLELTCEMIYHRRLEGGLLALAPSLRQEGAAAAPLLRPVLAALQLIQTERCQAGRLALAQEMQRLPAAEGLTVFDEWLTPKLKAAEAMCAGPD